MISSRPASASEPVRPMNNDTTSIPTTQLLKAEFSFFPSIKRKPDRQRKMTLAKFLKFQRTHPRWSSQVRTFRQAQGSAMGEHFRKDNLPAAKPSGCFTDLGASSLVSHSGILCVDIDVEANPSLATNDGATAIRERLRQDPHVIAFYASTGGKGLAVYVPVLAGADASRPCPRTGWRRNGRATCSPRQKSWPRVRLASDTRELGLPRPFPCRWRR